MVGGRLGWLDRRGGGLDGGKGDDEISMGDDRLVGGHRWMTAGGV